jgi:hypothetical protein
VSLPGWILSHLRWAYGGGLTPWPLKTAAELSAIGVVSILFPRLAVARRRAHVPPVRFPMVGLAVFAFLLGGFKAANDYADLPDLLPGLAAQGVSFLFLVLPAPGTRRGP